MNMNPTYRPSPSFLRRHQSGVALLIAMIALVAMALAGIALMRSVDTNVLVASNMAFRQATRESADAGIEHARNWLMKTTTESPDTLNNHTGSYYATRTGINLTGTDVNWEDNAHHSTSGGSVTPTCLPATETDNAGNVVCYVVQRMCDKTGPFDPDECDSIITSDGDTVVESRSDLIMGVNPGESPGLASSAVYRVTIRAAGPRNNWSYVQVFIAV